MAKVSVVLLAVLPFLGALVAAEPSFHMDDFGCRFADGNGNFLFAEGSKVVITSSGMYFTSAWD